MASTDTTPLTLDRRQLSLLFKGNPVAIRAFENLFTQSTATPSSDDVNDVTTTADQAIANAAFAIAQVEALRLIAQIGATLPPVPAEPPRLDYAPPAAIDALAYLTKLQQIARLRISYLTFVATGVSLSATGDTEIDIELPSGFTRFNLAQLSLSNCNTASITTAKGGLYTAPSQGGTIVAAQQLLTISNTVNTAGNFKELSGVAALAISASPPTPTPLYFNIGTAQGSGVTADLTIVVNPLP